MFMPKYFWYLHDEFIGLANSGSHPTDGTPWVHDSLASGDSGVGLEGAILEASHHEGYNHIALLLSHLGGDGQQHQHVVALSHAHSVQIAEDVSASNLP